MGGNLIIVESPHKAKQIQGFLGSENYKVVSSKGHVRDLEEKGMSIDIEHGFAPKYVISKDKKALVESLKKMAKEADVVWLASDPDREGEAIAWHLVQTLGLDPAKTRRITYNQVTKTAVQEAIQAPRGVDMDLVNAQQARRVMDRLVGFELSPVLWRKIRRGLSAGRVQSVTLRLVVDREREIAAFTPEPFYSVTGKFIFGQQLVSGTLDTRFKGLEDARKFLQDSIGAGYSVASVEQKEGTRHPAPPFITSTLQQEAARKLHFTSTKTMQIAQALYEKGLITYMRTDSTNLSGLALGAAKKFITDNFGAEYSAPRQYNVKVKGAQEAHEAIRPTYIENATIKGTPEELKLYDLIWKRTVASQMAEARVLNTAVKVASDRRAEQFVVNSVQVLFDGFLKLYSEGTDDSAESEDGNQILSAVVTPGQKVDCSSICADCKFTQAPWRYSEQTLIKKMGEIGIGRPSTTAPTIKILTSGRGYVVTADKEGVPTKVVNLTLAGGKITEKTKTENVGAEKHKLVPTDIGMMVSDYLVENFPDIMDYDFTARVEEDFDEIAEGKKEWTDVITSFYSPFHGKVDEALSNREFSRLERELGVDPTDGQRVVARFGQYGPYVQKGEGETKVFASLGKGQLIESITLEEALKLLQLPRIVGEYQGVDIVATKGRFGPYLRYGDKNVSLPRGVDPIRVSLEECIKLIDAEASKPAVAAPMKEFPNSGISIINGRYGPYLKKDGSNYKIPAGTDAAALSEQDCIDIIAGSAPTVKKYHKFPRKK